MYVWVFKGRLVIWASYAWKILLSWIPSNSDYSSTMRWRHLDWSGSAPLLLLDLSPVVWHGWLTCWTTALTMWGYRGLLCNAWLPFSIVRDIGWYLGGRTLPRYLLVCSDLQGEILSLLMFTIYMLPMHNWSRSLDWWHAAIPSVGQPAVCCPSYSGWGTGSCGWLTMAEVEFN